MICHEQIQVMEIVLIIIKPPDTILILDIWGSLGLVVSGKLSKLGFQAGNKGATTVSIDVAAVLSVSFLRLCGNQAMS